MLFYTNEFSTARDLVHIRLAAQLSNKNMHFVIMSNRTSKYDIQLVVDVNIGKNL